MDEPQTQQRDNNLLTHWLIDRLNSFCDKTALIYQEREWSYHQLLSHVENWLNVLDENKIATNKVVCIVGDYSPNVCALIIALIVNKNIIVPITNTRESKSELYALVLPDAVFNFETDSNYQLNINNKNNDNYYYQELRIQKESGLILFSSGSSGVKKAIVLNFDKLIDKYQVLKKGYTTLGFLILDHIGGINTLFFTLTQGGTLVTIKERNAESICIAIQKNRVELLPTTPTFIKLLLMSNLYKSYDLSSLKLITYGTEPMPMILLNELANIFPNVTLKQTYGLTEIGILPTQSEGINSLWFKLGKDVQYKIVDNILLVKVDSCMLGYLNATSPFDEDGWFITDDLVKTKVINQDEYLMILGRNTELINVGGEKVYPTEVENIILQIENITDVVVSGKPNPLLGQIVTAKVNLQRNEDLLQLRKRIREFCVGKIEPYKIPAIIEISDQPLFNKRFKKTRTVDVTLEDATYE